MKNAFLHSVLCNPVIRIPQFEMENGFPVFSKSSLAEALQPQLLREIRANHANPSETESGCALWNNRLWVEGLPGPHPLAPSPTTGEGERQKQVR